ncbi:zinc ribbon domain-containing protein [Ruminococcus sp. FC2018]|uniref:zinc ribbon domain-containing protein n=1 Tax=Ruminococcus sp. FC2018 TaxID=1410617 RepID=UPI00048CBA69|nr:zinc ribbon domain-containing protein [Ruminococcus sp. FC2018]
MAELFEYKCPSCGALLKIRPEESFVKCSYCGTIVERELDEDEKANASAKKLAAKLEKYKNDMYELERLKDRFLSTGVRVKELEKDSVRQTKFMHECPLVVPIIIMTLVVIGLIGTNEDKGATFLGGLVLAGGVYIWSMIGRSKEDTRVKEASEKLAAARKELKEIQPQYEKLKASFDPDVVPIQYRNDKALDYVITLFRTGQASNIGDAFRRYDEHLHYEKMEAMQQQQIDLQKQQLRKMDQMSSNDPNDLGSAALKAGAAVVGVVAATKIGKEIIKNLKEL